MLRGRVKSILLGCTSVAVLVVATATAQAGGFALREQSASGQGASFAGVAAGGGLSSMFWNPATMTQFYGKTFEVSGSAILPNAQHSYTNSALATATPAAYANNSGNSGEAAVVPSSYASWQLNDRLWVGMSVNAPFGLGVNFSPSWAGTAYAQDSNVAS